MQVKFKKLHEDAVLPSYAKPGDAGMDLTAVEKGEVIHSADLLSDSWYYVEYKTGISVEIPEGYVGLLFARSSISKSSLILANGVGVVDSGYRGEICLRFKIDNALMGTYIDETSKPCTYKKGDRIGQLVIIPYPTIEPEFTEELTTTERGAGGFGSTGMEGITV
jgi:dUTP pyrophosphatase